MVLKINFRHLHILGILIPCHLRYKYFVCRLFFDSISVVFIYSSFKYLNISFVFRKASSTNASKRSHVLLLILAFFEYFNFWNLFMCGEK